MPRLVSIAQNGAKNHHGPERGTVDPKRVLVIGGTQFIGRLLVTELLHRGHEVYILHRKPRHSFSKRVHNLVA
ncbi:MAG: NAD-dependent epimerase/dehydratase family protein, partial [Acidobacteriaceae bacterium]|nr:NAD-dependent epimerase/dehydratase family protein [Acidobacteriaceae bacterium]